MHVETALPPSWKHGLLNPFRFLPARQRRRRVGSTLKYLWTRRCCYGDIIQKTSCLSIGESGNLLVVAVNRHWSVASGPYGPRGRAARIRPAGRENSSVTGCWV